MKHIISLGAGVQSSALALMASKGEITPMPDFAVFADTQAEPESVYKWLDWLETQLSFPVYRVTKGDLSLDAVKIRRSKKGGTYLSNFIPYFGIKRGAVQQAMRQCTADYKIRPIQKFLREYKKEGVTQWLGISTDEAHRQKDSRVDWIENRYPLIEQNISRSDCLRWMEDNGFPIPPRSACVYCPYKSDIEWTQLKNIEPLEFQKAVDFEIALQSAQRNQESLQTIPFLHKTCRPLSKVQFRHQDQPNMFGNDCSGVCGV